MVDVPALASPLGWTCTCRRDAPDELARKVRAWGRDVAATWEQAFPARRGYAIEIAEAVDGVRLTARRGDFMAHVGLRHAAASEVRMFGRAESVRTLELAERNERTVARGRRIGAVLGLSPVIGLGWLSIGVVDPVFVLGGLLMVVVLVAAITAGSAIGAHAGERIAAVRRARVRAELVHDVALRSDLERWRALTRQYAALRHAVARPRGTPFRCPPLERALEDAG